MGLFVHKRGMEEGSLKHESDVAEEAKQNHAQSRS